MTADEIREAREAAEGSLAQTWAGGGDIPVGPSIPSAFQRAVTREKGLARDVLALADALEAAEQRIRELEAVEIRSIHAASVVDWLIGYLWSAENTAWASYAIRRARHARELLGSPAAVTAEEEAA